MRGDIRRALALVRRRTHRGPPLGARLLEKSDCGLCAEAYRALRRVALDVPLEIERVDITKDPALFDRYALRIPVVVVGERELDVAGGGHPAPRARVCGGGPGPAPADFFPRAPRPPGAQPAPLGGRA